jgi:hypothetical protein
MCTRVLLVSGSQFVAIESSLQRTLPPGFVIAFRLSLVARMAILAHGTDLFSGSQSTATCSLTLILSRANSSLADV